MNRTRKISVFITGLLFLLFISGCEQEGPAERAGEKIDKTIGQTQEKMEQAREKISDAAEETGEKLEEIGERLQKK